MTTNLPRWAVRGLPPWTLLISLPICLSLLIGPLADPTPGVRSVSGWLAAGAAGAIFLGVVLTRYRREAVARRVAEVLLILLAALAVGTTLAWSSAWASLFALLVIGVGIVVVHRATPALILGIAVAGIGVDLVAGGTADSALTTGLSVLFTGLGTYAVHQLFATVAELRRARQELARMAVAAERDRFARDLHDLLGHTLSVIVVKAEAVRRLAPLDSAAAVEHATDIEAIGREALADVRRAASGYRGAGLDRELARARAALDAAGVTLSLAHPASGGELPEELDVLLGWVVREAVTNVLRHARATQCRIGLRRTGGSVQLTIEDDGPGDAARDSRTEPGPTGLASGPAGPQPGAAGGDPGLGLSGLVERVTAAGGTVDAVPTARGFRITVDVPDRVERPVEVTSR